LAACAQGGMPAARLESRVTDGRAGDATRAQRLPPPVSTKRQTLELRIVWRHFFCRSDLSSLAFATPPWPSKLRAPPWVRF